MNKSYISKYRYILCSALPILSFAHMAGNAVAVETGSTSSAIIPIPAAQQPFKNIPPPVSASAPATGGGRENASADISEADSSRSQQSVIALKKSAASLQQAAASLQEAAASLEQANTLSPAVAVATSPASPPAVSGPGPIAAATVQPAAAPASAAASLPWLKTNATQIAVPTTSPISSPEVAAAPTRAALAPISLLNAPASAAVTPMAAAAPLPWIQAKPNAAIPPTATPAQPLVAASAIAAPKLTPPTASAPLPWIQAKPNAAMPTPAAPEQPVVAAKPLIPAVPVTTSPALAKQELLNEIKTADAAKPLVSALDAPTPARDVPLHANATAGGYSAFKEFLSKSKGLVALNVSKYAQEANVVEPIRLDEAVAFALKNNLEVKASDSRTKSAKLEKMAAYSRLLPSVDIKLSKGKEDSAPASYNDQFGNRVLNDQHTRTDRTLAIRQPLIDLEVVADIVTSEDKANLARNQERDDRDSVAYDTVNTYLKLLQSHISVQLADQYRAQLDELSTHMSARLEGGGATIGDLERIKAHASLAEVARAEALGEYESSLAEFRRLTQITPAQLQISEVLVPETPDSLNDALIAALKNNPSYVASQNKLDIASSVRDSSFAKIAPKVSLEYSDTFSYNAGGAANGNPVDGTYPNQQDKRLLVVARWALNGGLEVAQGMTAREKVREARFNSLDARSRIEEGIRASYNAINASNQRIHILQSNIESNVKVVREFEDQYKNGARSIFELLDAQAQLYNSRVNLMRVEIARALAAYQVRRQMGSLLTALIDQRHSNKKLN